MSVSIADVGMTALRRIAERYKAAGLLPEIERIPFEAKNLHRQVGMGYSTDILKAADVLADDLIARRVRRFAECPNHHSKAVACVLTDTSSGISIRVLLALDTGITLEAAGLADVTPDAEKRN